MPTPDQKAYAQAMKRITDRYLKLEDSTIKAAIDMLHSLRRNIGIEIMNVEGFEAYRLRELQAGIGRTIDQFQSQLSVQVRGDFGQAYELGASGVTEPLIAVNLPAFYQPNIAQVNVVLDFSADLIQQIVEPMRAQINTQIRLATLGERSPFQAMQAVTGILGVKARDLRWGRLKRPEVVHGVAARAEAILRTELTRVYSMAHHSQQMATAQEIPEIRKSWMATADGRTRISHINAHIHYSDNPIPINQPFEVGTAKLMFPGDPSGPAEETINCRCRPYTVHPAVGMPELPIDTQVRAEKAQREKAEQQKQVAKREKQLEPRRGRLPQRKQAGRAPIGTDITTNKLDNWLMHGLKAENIRWDELDITQPTLSHEIRSTAKDKIIKELSKRSGVEYEKVNDIVAQWAQSSNDRDMRSLALQKDAAELFNVPLSKFTAGRIKELEDQLETLRASHTSKFAEFKPPANLTPLYSSDVQKTVLRSMYEYTQEKLKEAGYKSGDTIRLRRGVNLPDSTVRGWNPGDTVTIEGNALESWSVGLGTARRFGRVTFEMDIHTDMIVGSARSGFGCLNEGEFVILGSVPGQAKILEVGGRRLEAMAKKVIKVNIGNTDENADWIKTKENKKTERKIHKELAKRKR